MYDAADMWTKEYTTTSEIMYPPEPLIRTLKGSYSGLKMPKPKPGDTVLDVGCGDGRNFPLFASLRMQPGGTEITNDIVSSLRKQFPSVDLRVGTCAALPWADASFDYLVTWNSCYYMSLDGSRFGYHVAEMARVIKPSGWIICSVPKTTHEIFTNAEFDDLHCTIRGDRFELRNGERMRWFSGSDKLQEAFSYSFTNFCHASIQDDMYGHAYHWHVIVAQRT